MAVNILELALFEEGNISRVTATKIQKKFSIVVIKTTDTNNTIYPPIRTCYKYIYLLQYICKTKANTKILL